MEKIQQQIVENLKQLEQKMARGINKVILVEVEWTKRI
jgi:hypothetical protein